MSEMDVFIDPALAPVYDAHPLILADVGARGGLKANWHPARRHLRIIGFEPDAREFAELKRRGGPDAGRTVLLNAALHADRRTVRLHVTRDAGLTSIFQPNRAFLDAFPDASRFDVLDTQELEVDALDAQLRAHNLTDVDFIKVDTQGSELFVLRGAAEALAGRVFGVEVEVEFAPVYRDQPLFADVDQYLRGLGFQLLDLRPCRWKRTAGRDLGGPFGQIIWADALYLKTPESLGSMLQSAPPGVRRSKVLRALSICLLYGYADYALEVARAARESLDPADLPLIERRLGESRAARSGLPAFPGRAAVSGALRRLWMWTRPRPQGWSVSGARLGNPD